MNVNDSYKQVNLNAEKTMTISFMCEGAFKSVYVYDSKRNVIITNNIEKTSMHLIDINAMQPKPVILFEFQSKFNGLRMTQHNICCYSYCEINDIYVFGTSYGHLIRFDPKINGINQMEFGQQKFNDLTQNCEIVCMIHIDDINLMFVQNECFFLVNLSNNIMTKIYDLRFNKSNDIVKYISYQKKHKILYVGSTYGELQILNFNKMHHPKLIQKIHVYDIFCVCWNQILIKNRQYYISIGDNCQIIKIWDIFMGKIRLVKKIFSEDKIMDFMCLEEYGMLVTTTMTNSTYVGDLNFYNIYSGLKIGKFSVLNPYDDIEDIIPLKNGVAIIIDHGFERKLMQIIELNNEIF